jgi:hypothetical protein
VYGAVRGAGQWPAGFLAIISVWSVGMCVDADLVSVVAVQLWSRMTTTALRRSRIPTGCQGHVQLATNWQLARMKRAMI